MSNDPAAPTETSEQGGRPAPSTADGAHGSKPTDPSKPKPAPIAGNPSVPATPDASVPATPHGTDASNPGA
jgi:hypothetical protein